MICTAIDDFLEEKTIWVCQLSNGIMVYQDDNRPNISPSSAWLRLKTYALENKVRITRMFLKFRSHVVELPHYADAYFFCKGIARFTGTKNLPSYNCGAIFKNVETFECIHFLIPELEPLEIEQRSVKDLNEDCVIYNE